MESSCRNFDNSTFGIKDCLFWQKVGLPVCVLWQFWLLLAGGNDGVKSVVLADEWVLIGAMLVIGRLWARGLTLPSLHAYLTSFLQHVHCIRSQNRLVALFPPSVSRYESAHQAGARKQLVRSVCVYLLQIFCRAHFRARNWLFVHWIHAIYNILEQSVLKHMCSFWEHK